MNEQETRQELEALLARYHKHYTNFREDNLPGGFVEFHFSKMRHSMSDGNWDSRVASEYLQSLESEMPDRSVG